MARLAVLAAMLCGCAQLFGLDETSGGPTPPSLTIQRTSIGARVVTAPQDLSGLMATYLVTDEADPSGLSRVAATQAEPGRWTAPLTAAAPILFELPDYPKPLLRLFDFPQRDVKALFGVLEHPGPQPAPMDATITVNATLDVPFNGTDRFELFTLGSWNVVGLAPPPVGTAGLAQTFPFTAMNSITGRPHERITIDDTAVVLRYAGNELRGAFKAAPFNQTGTDTITGALTTVALEPFSFAIDQMDLMRRYAAVRPLVGTPSTQWTIRAAPGAQLNQDLGPLLAAAQQPADPSTVSGQVGNPFAPDWPSTVLWLSQASRTYTPPALALPVTLIANMHQRAILEPGLQMKLPAGMPSRVTLGSAVLETDGVTIAKPTRAVEITFTTDVPENTLYQLQLFRLVPNANNTALQLELVLGANAAQPRFVLPPELFEAGAVYTLRVGSVQGGFPGLAEGDLTQRSIPIAISVLDSGVFQVAP